MGDKFRSSQWRTHMSWPIGFQFRSEVLVINLFLFLNSCFSQRADFEMPENQLNRRFSWSTDAPLTKAINDLAPDAIPHIDLLIHHATRVEKAVLESLKRPKLIPDAPVQPCNPLITKRYRRSTERAFGVRGFLEPAWNCGSDVSGEKTHAGEFPGYTLDDLYNAAFNRGATIKRRVNEIALRLIKNFTQPEVPFNFTYDTFTTNCVLSSSCMYRNGDNWHQAIGIHSHGRDDYVRDGKRQSIWEYMRVVNGKLGDNLLLRLPVYDNGTIERVMRENTTTLIQMWRRAPNPSCVLIVPIEENPAILEALDLADHSSQQAQDAVTSSNLAILILPLGLNLVPIALFADVSTPMMLFYTLMSDVLTVIPLAIKGVELTFISVQRYRSVVTRMMSPFYGNLTIPQAAFAEIWAAECRIREEVWRTGIALLITSLVCLCIGIASEFVARRYVRQRKMGRVRRLDYCFRRKRSSVDNEAYTSERLSSSGGGTFPTSSHRIAASPLDHEIGAGGVDERYSLDLGTADRKF